MTTKRIYLAGALGCYGDKAEYPKVWRNRAKDFVNNMQDFYTKDVKWECVSPVDFYEYGAGLHKTEKEIMHFEVRCVKNGDVVLVNIKDLEKSTGTNDEILYAWTHNIPVIGFLETDDVLTEKEVESLLHPWKYEQISRIDTGKFAMDDALRYILDYYYL